MLVRNLVVRNFRGIQNLEWSTSSRFICLIGPGDSGKTTLLDAIALVLEPRWNVSLSDSDFFECDITKPIEITATVTGVPVELMKISAAGLFLRGVAPDGTVHDEPIDGDACALTIRFTADDSLEPKWEFVKDSMSEERRCTARERELLGASPVGTDPGMHLKWVRGSALSKSVEGAEAASVLVGAYREARQAVFDHPSEKLNTCAGDAAELLRRIGGADLRSPRAGLDPGMMRRGAPLVLHDGEIPATGLGRGSQRLAGLAFQMAALNSESILLVDEIEFGLEPHRLLHVLKVLRDRQTVEKGQVLLTTHSPLVIEAVRASDLCVVRLESGRASVMQVPDELDGMRPSEPQATVRSGASAMLARRIVVCEGPTEVGLCRALVSMWDEAEDLPMALVGTAVRDGRGSEAPKKAQCLARLGYGVALLVDNDLDTANRVTFSEDTDKAVADGVRLLRWESGYSVEEQLIQALPEAALASVVELAAEFKECEDPGAAVRDAVASRLGVPSGAMSGLDPLAWAVQTDKPIEAMRTAIASTAKQAGWFKDQTRGERFGELLVASYGAIDSAGVLMTVLSDLRAFIYGSQESSAAVAVEHAAE